MYRYMQSYLCNRKIYGNSLSNNEMVKKCTCKTRLDQLSYSKRKDLTKLILRSLRVLLFKFRF